MPPKPLYYTFGNHMHWVDMQWLWGYDVLPGSVRDMLHLCQETGARGNINFDGIGYEKMAAECPEALAQLRDAVQAGTIEPVGCSYGQPYGLFHGGESNIRQLTYGVRAVRRLLGVRPTSFWEEEFYFFPQLPQMLAQCGFTGACLFFQWTWHTPELPKEPHNLILWEGIDGTRLPTLPRNTLNVHQWPEDFDGLLDSGLIKDLAAPAIVQWLELMPSRDWMCRSELLLPRLKSLFSDPRFEIRPRTISQLIHDLTNPERKRAGPPTPTAPHISVQPSPERKRAGSTPQTTPSIPIRAYTMDDVWHGMTLGKNADRHPRASHRTEATIQQAESLAAIAALLGRPYSSWDAYPTWELDEAWRNTLAAQHHDNHECEGLCGFVGHHQFEHAQRAAAEVSGRTSWQLHQRTGSKLIEFNHLGWARKVIKDLSHFGYSGDITVPPFGYAARPRTGRATKHPVPVIKRSKGRLTLSRPGITVEIDPATGAITQIRADSAPTGILGPDAALFQLGVGGQKPGSSRTKPTITLVRDEGTVTIEHTLAGGTTATVVLSLVRGLDAVDCRVYLGSFAGTTAPAELKPGLNGALCGGFRPGFNPEFHAGTPFAIDRVTPYPSARRKYPSGDWMTAPQWFEDVPGPITSMGLLDFVNPATQTGLLVCHDAALQWLTDKRGLNVVLSALDPWDEARYDTGPFYDRLFRLIPHGPITNAARVRAAAEFAADHAGQYGSTVDHSARPVGGGSAPVAKKDIPATFGALEVTNAPNVLAHALFRESTKSGEHLPDWAGHRMVRESQGACDHPYIIRLVEWDNKPAEVLLKLPGPIALAAKTNLLGEVGPHVGGGADTAWLDIIPNIEPPSWADGAKLKGQPIPWSALRFTMRPREIATIYADLVMGRKQWRNLDDKRNIWATVHRDKLQP